MASWACSFSILGLTKPRVFHSIVWSGSLRDGGKCIFNGSRHEAKSDNIYGMISNIFLGVILGFNYDIHNMLKMGEGHTCFIL